MLQQLAMCSQTKELQEQTCTKEGQKKSNVDGLLVFKFSTKWRRCFQLRRREIENFAGVGNKVSILYNEHN